MISTFQGFSLCRCFPVEVVTLVVVDGVFAANFNRVVFTNLFAVRRVCRSRSPSRLHPVLSYRSKSLGVVDVLLNSDSATMVVPSKRVRDRTDLRDAMRRDVTGVAVLLLK